MRGLPISVYRDADGSDCTNGGVSRNHKRLLLVGKTVRGFVDPNDPRATEIYGPVVELVEGALPGIARIVPINRDLGAWFMFGGNYGATSDSRFREAVEAITGGTFYGAVPIHDRCEG